MMGDDGGWDRVMAEEVAKGRQILEMLGKQSPNNLLLNCMWDLTERENRDDSKIFGLS